MSSSARTPGLHTSITSLCRDSSKPIDFNVTEHLEKGPNDSHRRLQSESESRVPNTNGPNSTTMSPILKKEQSEPDGCLLKGINSTHLLREKHQGLHRESCNSINRDSNDILGTDSDDKLSESQQDSLNSLLGSESHEGEGCVDDAIECTSLTNNVCAMSCSEQPPGQKKKFVFCGTVGQAVGGCALLLASVISLVFTPLDLMLWEKLNMRPGLPPFDWWAEPPDEVRLRVHVFNVTNHERFLRGHDARIHVHELGPITYLEKLQHSNISFNDNSTMTYTARRTPIYLPLDNTIDLDSYIIVPNIAVLGLASYLHDAPYFVQAAFRLVVQSHGSAFFVRRTIRQYLWDFREPVLDTSANLAPGLVPVDNMGVLARMYADFVDVVTVHIGSEWGHRRFFQLDRFRGQPQLPGYDPKTCPDRIFGATEGVMYAQRLTKHDRLLYWRKSVCKLMPLYFDEEMVLEDIPVYRYNLSEQAFDRVKNGTDCYDSKPPLPDGLSDASRCFFDFPMVISYPHFYTGSPTKDKYVTGLTPDRYKHNSYVIVEPLTGTPLRSVARMQSNLRIADLSSFGAEYHRFSDLVLPMFWGEYNQEGLPDYIRKTIYFAVVVLPPLQTIVSSVLLFVGCCLLVKLIYLKKLQNQSLATLLPTFNGRQKDVLTRNKIFNFEKDSLSNK